MVERIRDPEESGEPERCFFCGAMVPAAAPPGATAFVSVVAEETNCVASGWMCHVDCLRRSKHSEIEWPW
jgi:hypothetical protein